MQNIYKTTLLNMKKLFLVLFAATMFAACNNSQNSATIDNPADEQMSEAPVEITLAEFSDKAEGLVGKQIVFTGIVDHTCKHGGKRMFIVDENSDAHLKVESGENISSFDASLEGSEVKVVGIVNEKIIDKAYLDEWEADVQKEIESSKNLHMGNHEKGKEGEGEEENEAEESMNQIKNLREMLAESGKDHLSFYSVECVEYEVIPDKEDK
jgi:fructose-specific component phosphotransferase system IIB-like protein